MMDPLRYTFVTVGFAGDTGLLRLQARSMRLYCPADLVDEIIVVDNSQPAASNRWRAELLHHYGKLSKLVRFISGAEVVTMPVDAGGWWTQQVLKIKIAELIRSERYVLLDAKNHLISQLGLDFLETAAGLPRINGHSFIKDPMRDFLERTLSYFGLNRELYLNWFTRTTTPFTILTSEARSLVQYLEDREGKPFALAFLEKQPTEFFLYSGFLEAKGILKSSYDLNQPHCAQIWGETASETGCAEAIHNAENANCPFMTVHREAITKMDRRGRAIVAEFWHARGLFPSVIDATRFLRDPNRTYQDYNGRVYPWPMGYFVFHFDQRWKTAFRRRGTLQ
jgi:hypothetical protein